jgi:hypothetical protein
MRFKWKDPEVLFFGIFKNQRFFDFRKIESWTGGSLKIQITARRWFRRAQNEVTTNFVHAHQTPLSPNHRPNAGIRWGVSKTGGHLI